MATKLDLAQETETFRSLKEEIRELSSPLYTLLYGATVLWKGVKTASVSVNKRDGNIVFRFSPEFWGKLNNIERLFLMIHECYHLFLDHFERFPVMDKDTNAAIDVAVNHSILRHFTIEQKDIPFLRQYGCWADTLIPGKVLLDSLSAEEYVLILQQHRQQQKQDKQEKGEGQGSGSGDNDQDDSEANQPLDEHTQLNDEEREALKDKLKDLKDEIKELFPEMTEEEVEKDIDELKEQLAEMGDDSGLLAGSGRGAPIDGLEILKKSKNPWVRFSKQFKRHVIGERIHQTWMPNKRIGHLLEEEGLMLPTDYEMDIEAKIPVILLLDTSGSCHHLVKHFMAFAKVIPKDLFEIYAYGFTTEIYQIDLKNPRLRYGGTSFSNFENHFQKFNIPKKYAFVFTDGEGSSCRYEQPDRWHWFIDTRKPHTWSYVPAGAKRYNLQDFE